MPLEKHKIKEPKLQRLQFTEKNMMRILLGLFTLVILVFIFACNPEDDLITSADAKLEFSLDTLTFDTVFTARGSATRILKVYNRNKQSIRIDRISVEGGSNSAFRLNVDGFVGNEAEDLIVRAEDSLYVFGEVTVDPDQGFSVSPFVMEDNIVFETNGNTQKVLLEAWGQNANYVPVKDGKGLIAGLTCNGGEVVWDDPRPYVIFGILVIDDCTLRLPAGTRIYVHGGLSQFVDNTQDPPIRELYNDGRIVVSPTGRLISEGTVDNPVIIQGDRLEEDFEEDAGQWFGVLMTAGSKNNRLEHTTIKNSIIGVAVDSAASLSMDYVQIYNTSANGLLGIRSTITANNCLFYNNGSGAVRMIYGGDYNFNYCTMASYGLNASALTLTNALCLTQLCDQYRPYRLNANIKNSIIFGSRDDEIILSQVPEADFNYQLQDCIVRVTDLTDPGEFPMFFTNCDPCINGNRESILFVDPSEDDYHLDSLSIAEMQATPIVNINLDIEGKTRDATMPDIGCYEYED